MEIIFFNNNYFPSDAAVLTVNDRGFLLGDGIFETLRIYSGRVLFLEQHWKRLASSADFMGILLPVSLDDVANIIAELIEKNQLCGKNASARITLTRGPAPRGISISSHSDPSLLITVHPLVLREQESWTAIISSLLRNEKSPLSKIKSLNYLDNILARREAEKVGANEALLLNTEGNLCEASTANLFVVKEGTIYTPPIEDGALPGITRHIVLDLSKKLGFVVKISSIRVSDLETMEEAFVTNSLIGIRPLLAINGQALKQDKIGKVTLSLQEEFNAYIASLLSFG
jgi:branched-chain amino acid aminotransferase